jgi:hypothetical protein
VSLIASPEATVGAKTGLNLPRRAFRLENRFAVNQGSCMPFFAAATTTADKLRQIPNEFWLKLGIGIVAIVAVVVVLRKLAHVNKGLLALGVALVASIIGFNWIYERNEPRWATPVVEHLAGFFPSKGTQAKNRQ